MYKDDNAPDRSVRGYLSRRPTKELKAILDYCLQEDRYKEYDYAILTILDILSERFELDEPSEAQRRILGKIVNFRPVEED